MKPDKQSNNLEDVGKLKVISKSDGSIIAGWWSTDERVFVLMIYSPFLVPLYVIGWTWIVVASFPGLVKLVRRMTSGRR